MKVLFIGFFEIEGFMGHLSRSFRVGWEGQYLGKPEGGTPLSAAVTSYKHC